MLRYRAIAFWRLYASSAVSYEPSPNAALPAFLAPWPTRIASPSGSALDAIRDPIWAVGRGGEGMGWAEMGCDAMPGRVRLAAWCLHGG